MRRLLPYPVLFVGLFVMWLLIQQSLGVGQSIMAFIIAFCATHAMAALTPDQPKIRNPHKIIQLIGVVAVDVVRSNYAVARIILEGSKKEQTSGFVLMHLKLKDKVGLAVLSCILTATPGSAWLEYNAADNTVLIHVLDLVDETEWVDTIRHRYEALLLEIFQ